VIAVVGTTGRDAEAEVPVIEVPAMEAPAAYAAEVFDEIEIPRQPMV
jgi:hypothetical protein